MSKVFEAMMRAQGERDASREVRSLGDRLRRWLPGRREPARVESGPARDLLSELRPTAPDPAAVALQEKLASLEVAVDALDDRLSAEVAEREAKLLEEIRRGMLGLETELAERVALAIAELRRSLRRSTALVLAAAALLSGLVVGLLSAGPLVARLLRAG